MSIKMLGSPYDRMKMIGLFQKS